MSRPKLDVPALRLKLVYVRHGPHPGPVEYQRLIFDAQLPDSNSKYVLLCLSSYLSNRLHYAFPSAEKIAEDTQMSRTVVLAALTTLLRCGYIRRKRRWGATPLYWITWGALPYVDERPTAKRAVAAGTVSAIPEAPAKPKYKGSDSGPSKVRKLNLYKGSGSEH